MPPPATARDGQGIATLTRDAIGRQITPSGGDKAQRRTFLALSVVSGALAMAVWIAAATRSTPPPLNRIALPTQVQPLTRAVHEASSNVPGRDDFSTTKGAPHNSDRRGALEEDLEYTDTDTDTAPVALEAVPLEDRALLSANHGPDVSRSTVTPAPAPPRAAVDPEPRSPDDPRDFELPSHPLRSEQ